ncbi:MAG: 50S ribosomal protein L29 [Candidatus Aenigmatarchaeota archaeon]
MAILRTKDIRTMKYEDRLKRINEFRLELAKLKGSSAVGAAIKETGKVKEFRKAIARIFTINNEDKKAGKIEKVPAKKSVKKRGGKEQ